MCVILIKEPGKEVPFEKLKAACHHNEDGYGIMYHDGTNIQATRYYNPKGNDPEQVAKRLESLKAEQVYIHLRIRTSGRTNLNGCHPFKLLDKDKDGEDLYLMHNGVMTDWERNDTDYPDSYFFGKEVVAPLFKTFWLAWDQYPLKDELFQKAASNFLGYNHSKILLLDGTGELFVINQNKGTNFDWGWASNNSYFWLPTERRSSFRADPDKYTEWWETRSCYGSYGMSDEEWEDSLREDGLYPEPEKSKGNFRSPSSPLKSSSSKALVPNTGPQQTMAKEIIDADFSDEEDSEGVRASDTVNKTGRGQSTSPMAADSVPQGLNTEAVNDAGELPASLKREKLEVPRMKPRKTFLEAIGAKHYTLRDMCSWSREDILDLIENYPKESALLVMDLLEKVYILPKLETVSVH